MANAKRIFLGVFILVVSSLFLVAMIRYASILGFLMIYPYVLSAAFDITINPYLAKALAIILGLIVWFIVFKLFMRWNAKKCDLGFVLLAVVVALHALAMFFITSDRLVDPRSGERKWCVVDKISHEVVITDIEAFDEFGQKAHRCTDLELEQVIKRRRGIK